MVRWMEMQVWSTIMTLDVKQVGLRDMLRHMTSDAENLPSSYIPAQSLPRLTVV